MKKILTSIVILTILSFTGCVRAIKYDTLKQQVDGLELAKTKAETRSDSLSKHLEKINYSYGKVQTDYQRAKDDYIHLDSLYKRNKKLSDDLFEKYELLDKSYSRLLNNGNIEAGKLSGDLSKKEKELLAAEQKIMGKQADNDKLNLDLQEREAKLNQLEKVLAEKEKAVNDLKVKVSNALLNFKGSDLSVETKNGKVYVSLAEKLLFKSGSYTVDAKGAEAIKKLAEVLKNQSDINVLVEGHTDDKTVSAGTVGYKDNWDLSVLRSTAIVRILTLAGAPPTKLTAAGRAQYFPLDPSKTISARQKNRRTEIILTPKLDELFKIIGDQ